jgi:hypothetical protein
LSTPQQPGQGIAITSKLWRDSRLFPPHGPIIFINGQPAPPGGWGRTFHPLPPGQYHIHMFVPHTWSLGEFGPADYVALVHPGQVLELEYAPPFGYGRPGSLGPGPQQHVGEADYWHLVAIIATGVVVMPILVFGGIYVVLSLLA